MEDEKEMKSMTKKGGCITMTSNGHCVSTRTRLLEEMKVTVVPYQVHKNLTRLKNKET